MAPRLRLSPLITHLRRLQRRELLLHERCGVAVSCSRPGDVAEDDNVDSGCCGGVAEGVRRQKSWSPVSTAGVRRRGGWGGTAAMGNGVGGTKEGGRDWLRKVASEAGAVKRGGDDEVDEEARATATSWEE